MAYAIRKNIITGEPEIVINGWENGTADSPHLGLADVRNINNDSQPGIALCNHALTLQTQTPITSVAFTADAGTNYITWTGQAIDGQYPAILFTGADLPDPLVAGTIYYLIDSANTSRVSTTPGGAEVNITDVGSGTMTFSTINLGNPKQWAVDTRTGYYYVQDSNARIWTDKDIGGGEFYLLSGNTLTNGNGNGLAIFKDYLLVFRNQKIDTYGPLTTGSGWTNDWATMNASAGSGASHFAKVGQDDIVYFCDTYYIGSIMQVTGKTFTPSDASTYTYTSKALTLPETEMSTCLEEQLVNLVVGTSNSNMLYPWDRTSTSFSMPLRLPEIGTARLLNINNILYIFAGNRGNIYYTNGSSCTLFKTLPKYPFGNDPYVNITWGGVMALNNNLVFGVSGTGGSGIWAVQLSVGQLGQTIPGAIRYKGQPSAGQYVANVLIPFSDGLRYYAGWYTGSLGGIDVLASSTNTYYSNYESYLETDIIPIGTSYQPKTFNTIEMKLDRPLASGEKVRVSMRSDLSASYTQVFECTTAGSIDCAGSITVQGGKWIQLKCEIQTINGSSRTLTRLKELIIR